MSKVKDYIQREVFEVQKLWGFDPDAGSDQIPAIAVSSQQSVHDTTIAYGVFRAFLVLAGHMGWSLEVAPPGYVRVPLTAFAKDDTPLYWWYRPDPSPKPAEAKEGPPKDPAVQEFLQFTLQAEILKIQREYGFDPTYKHGQAGPIAKALGKHPAETAVKLGELKALLRIAKSLNLHVDPLGFAWELRHLEQGHNHYVCIE